ncbi:MAG: hypothetical protein Q9159_004478 [Coniocarpon cinnabarinum]
MAEKSASSASEEDIPFSKKAAQDQPAEEEEDDDEEELFATNTWARYREALGAAIERGTDIAQTKPKLQYEVKWIGWEETTWEPQENLDNCPDELQEYYTAIGGKPEPPSSAKKRPAQDSSTPTAKGRASSGKRAKTEDDLSIIRAATGENTWKAPQGSWEDHVLAVDSMTRDENGDNIAFLVWNNKHRSRHSTKLLNHKCPQKLLAFYEAHLPDEEEEEAPVKEIASAGTDSQANAPGPAEKNGVAAENEDDEMEGVKGVAPAA